VDLYETKEAFILEADLPGVKSEDVKVEVENSDLVLQGWRTLEKSHSDEQIHTMERSSGHFMRRMKLPASVDKDAIQAEFRDGVLRVILPKSKQKKRGEAR
jgi:HSP20 family protein